MPQLQSVVGALHHVLALLLRAIVPEAPVPRTSRKHGQRAMQVHATHGVCSNLEAVY